MICNNQILEEFFRHESSLYPPALSCDGSLNSCTKSHLLVNIMEATSVHEDLVAPDAYDFIINDGGALIHSLPGTSVHGKNSDVYLKKFSVQEFTMIWSNQQG